MNKKVELTVARAKEIIAQLKDALEETVEPAMKAIEETSKPTYINGNDLSGYFQDDKGKPKSPVSLNKANKL